MTYYAILELKLYFYDRRKIYTWRRKNKDKILGKGRVSDDGYHYICMVRLYKGEIIKFPDTAINLVEQNLKEIIGI